MSKTAANVLEGRGYFWWHDATAEDYRFAPMSAAPGLLIIEASGRAVLKIDGSLLQAEYPSGLPFDSDQIDLSGRYIVGRITESRIWIYLLNPTLEDSHQHDRRILFEEYGAQSCLVGHSPADKRTESLRFSSQSISLKGLEEWKRGDAIEVNLTDVEGLAHTQEVKYTVGRDVYEIEGGTILLRSDVYRHPSFALQMKSRHVNFAQEDWLDYSPVVPATAEEMRQEFVNIEEFLAILVGSYYCLEWPELALGEGKGATSFTLYFWRNFESAVPPEIWNLWTVFPQVRGQFGSLYSAWRQKKIDCGPGFYLYLGTLRRPVMYVEHRFVNLIWGIESLHRRQQSVSEESAKGKSRLEKILKCVRENTDERTEQWLARKLKFADEPSLEKRIVEMFDALPLKLEKVKIRAFAAGCAKRRNDISHFGGPRPKTEEYKDFVQELVRLSHALSYLYHAAILHEIGLEDEVLQTCFYKHPLAHRIKSALREAGILIDGAD